MTVSIHLEGDNAGVLLADLQRLAFGLLSHVPAPAGSTATGAAAEPSSVTPAAGASEPARRGRRAATPAQTIEGAATEVVEPAGDTAMLTVDDARERMKTFAKDGHLEQVEAALAHFKIKKLSDMDPDAKGKPSAKFAEFVAKIEELVAAKPAPEAA